MEILLNNNIGNSVLWCDIKDEKEHYEKLQELHVKHFIRRQWFYQKYLFVFSFLGDNNVKINKKQKDVYVRLNEQSCIYPMQHRFEIYLRANMVHLKYKDDKTINFRDTGLLCQLYTNVEEYAREQLGKELENDNDDKCIVCYNDKRVGTHPLLWCAKCKFDKIKYCSKECQTLDWKNNHKYFCNTIVEINKKKSEQDEQDEQDNKE